MRSCLGLLLAWAAFGQENAPTGILRGEAAVIDPAGSLDVRASGDKLYRCYFDKFTYSERDGHRVDVRAIKAGDRLEIIADQKQGRCYARTIHVVDPRSAALLSRPGIRPRRNIDNIFPRGNLTFAGVVLRFNPDLLVLRVHGGGEKTILLRNDTRFMESGLASDLKALLVNTRVFVRGGKNFDDDLEAYQVIWGHIEGPRPGLWSYD
jgi:hypothetical protein